MKSVGAILPALLFLLLAACSQVPAIRPDGGMEGKAGGGVCCGKACLPFVEGPCKLVHAIEAKLPDGTTASALGIAAVDPQRNALHCVLMTPEGFILLEAVDDGETAIRRGVPPFNHRAFAEALMADLRLVLLPPRETLQEAGVGKDGAPICRYSDRGGRITDVVDRGGGNWEILTYDTSGYLQRRVRLSSAGPSGIFGRIELEAKGLTGYSLTMTLFEVQGME